MRCSVRRATEAARFLQSLPEQPGFPTGPGVVVKFEGIDRDLVHRPIRMTDTNVISQRDALRIQARMRRALEGSGRVAVPNAEGKVMVENLYPVNTYNSNKDRRWDHRPKEVA